MKNIIEKNEDVLLKVYASSNYGVHGYGIHNKDKCLSLLITTDIHGDEVRLKSAVEYLNKIESLDAGLFLGDAQPCNFAENDGKWFFDTLKGSKKNVYCVCGNHDKGNSAKGEICGTDKEVNAKLFQPINVKNGIKVTDKLYFRVDFEEYGITLIVLDVYETGEKRDEKGDFVISRGVVGISQEQIDWFINELKDIPIENHLIVAMHTFNEPYRVNECVFTDVNMESVIEPTVYLEYGISDIVDAWIKGEKLDKEYKPQEKYSGKETLKVRADFGGKRGTFVSYMIGHHHKDFIGEVEKYPEQKIISFCSSATDDWQNACSDIPRVIGSKSEDAITVVSVDKNKRRIRLVRVGSNITTDLTDRTTFVIKY